MTRENTKLIITADGSHTLLDDRTGETYHSVNGALAESFHVFIKAGLHQVKADNIHILEIGLGAGLNALLTCIESKKLQLKVDYLAVEAFPLEETIWRQLNYSRIIGNGNTEKIFCSIHNASHGIVVQLTSWMTFRKLSVLLQEVLLAEQAFDLVYYDAFSPAVQPELWTVEIFEKIYAACKPDAILVTYCARGAVRRAMKDAGFYTERLPGAPGKREMLRARKTKKE